HSGSFMGAEVPVWDIADRFGDTNLLVTNMDQGRDLAQCLGRKNLALMRGHGFAAAARSLVEVVRMSVYTPRHARALLAALPLGGLHVDLNGGPHEAGLVESRLRLRLVRQVIACDRDVIREERAPHVRIHAQKLLAEPQIEQLMVVADGLDRGEERPETALGT